MSGINYVFQEFGGVGPGWLWMDGEQEGGFLS